MRHKKSVPNYSKWIKRARASRRVNIAACALLMCGAAAGAVFACGTPYRLPALLSCAALELALAGLLIKNVREARAAMDIARTGNYAVMLSDAQQDMIAAQQKRRGQCFYLSAFLGLVTPTAIVLTAISMRTGERTYLVVMGAAAFAALAAVVIASMYLTARLRARDSFFTVSPHGILVGKEIIPFETRDVETLLKFDDFYLLRFVKSEVFGITHRSEIIIPTDGVVRDGIGRSADEEIVSELGLGGLFATTGSWFECRDYGERDSVGADAPKADEERESKAAKRRRRRDKKRAAADGAADAERGDDGAAEEADIDGAAQSGPVPPEADAAERAEV